VRINIGSRKSDLARLQAYRVGEAIQKKLGSGSVEIIFHFKESLGDKNLTDPLWKMPEKGVFTEDFYQDLLTGQVDMVVHSWKDLPTEGKPETEIYATLPRADQRDLLLVKKNHLHKVQQQGCIKIFSSSPRRFYNLEPFLKKVIPAVNASMDIHFENVLLHQ
jgi:hydroxymethylbilane synthase